MPKKKLVSHPDIIENKKDALLTAFAIPQRLSELSHEFSNGELNILRDKINEIIRS